MNVFVYSGGSTNGSYLAGARLMLRHRGIDQDVLFSNSIGSINGFLENHNEPHLVCDMWETVKSKKQFLVLNSWELLTKLWNAEGIYRMDPLEKMMRHFITDKLNFRHFVATTSIQKRKIEYHDSSQMSTDLYLKRCLGSGAEPVIFKPVDGHLDAGLKEFLPYNEAKNRYQNANFYLLSTRPFKKNLDPKEIKINLWNMLGFAVDVLTHDVGFHDFPHPLDKNVHVIAPDDYLPGSLNFNNDDMRRNLELGYNSKIKTLEELYAEA